MIAFFIDKNYEFFDKKRKPHLTSEIFIKKSSPPSPFYPKWYTIYLTV